MTRRGEISSRSHPFAPVLASRLPSPSPSLVPPPTSVNAHLAAHARHVDAAGAVAIDGEVAADVGHLDAAGAVLAHVHEAGDVVGVDAAGAVAVDGDVSGDVVEPDVARSILDAHVTTRAVDLLVAGVFLDPHLAANVAEVDVTGVVFQLERADRVKLEIAARVVHVHRDPLGDVDDEIEDAPAVAVVPGV